MTIELSQEIITHCLNINDTLKAIQKALENDDNHDYSHLLEHALELNWSNHQLASKISHEDYKAAHTRSSSSSTTGGR